MIGKKFLAITFASLSLGVLAVPASQAGGLVDDSNVMRYCELMRDDEDIRNFGISLIYEKNNAEEISKISKEFVDNFDLSCKNLINELKQNEKMKKNYELFLKLVEKFGKTEKPVRRHTLGWGIGGV